MPIMSILYGLIFALSLCGMKYQKSGFVKSYLDKSTTLSVNGLFILLVFASHVNQYIRLPNPIGVRLGQLIVVTFFFYSGYGVMESIKNRDGYLSTMPRHRILMTWLKFVIAVVCFDILNFILGIPISRFRTIFSFVGWSSVGNSNWYIFDILVCYTTTWISFTIFQFDSKGKVSGRKALILNFVLLIIFTITLCLTKPSWWWDTVMLYGVGFLYSYNKNALEAFLNRRYWLVFFCVIVFFIILLFIPISFVKGFFSICFSLLFACIVLLITLKVKFGNPVLLWLGVHLFPIYIYQRLPMIAFSTLGAKFVNDHPCYFILLSLSITLVITWVYDFVQQKCKQLDIWSKGNHHQIDGI